MGKLFHLVMIHSPVEGVGTVNSLGLIRGKSCACTGHWIWQSGQCVSSLGCFPLFLQTDSVNRFVLRFSSLRKEGGENPLL